MKCNGARGFPRPAQPVPFCREQPMLTGTNPLYTKQYNLRIVHEVIRLRGPLTRAEIAHETALTVQTVGNLTKELIAQGLIYEASRRRERRGPPSATLAINPDGAFTIGLDLDRDHLTGVLVDLAGRVRQQAHEEVNFPSPTAAMDLLADMADELIAGSGLKRGQVSGVGLGVPGLMHRTPNGGSYLVNPTAIPGWHDVPLADLLQARLHLPIFIENNATAAALGERWYGAGQEIRTFFYLYFGSGLGGGVVIDGRSYPGFTGNAGEIGYVPSRRHDSLSHIGTCFYMPRLFDMLRQQGTSVQRPEDLDSLLAAHNPLLLDWLQEAADHLAEQVVFIEYLLDPEAIFFGGRLPERVLSALVERLEQQVPRCRAEGRLGRPRYLLATAGADAGALGVAILPMYAAFAPAHGVLLKAGKHNKMNSKGLRRALLP